VGWGGGGRGGEADGGGGRVRWVEETGGTAGGAPVYVWPGGGITIMVDVAAMPDNSFGYVPTPAIVAPIEFTLRLADYEALGGHMAAVRRVEEIVGADRLRVERWREQAPWPGAPLHGLAAGA